MGALIVQVVRYRHDIRGRQRFRPADCIRVHSVMAVAITMDRSKIIVVKSIDPGVSSHELPKDGPGVRRPSAHKAAGRSSLGVLARRGLG